MTNTGRPATTLERAFELARSGECRTVSEVRQRLKAEGLDARQIDGPMLTRQLRMLCNANRGDQPASPREG